MAQRGSRQSSSSKEPRSEYWRAQSVAWLSSGLTQAEFCEEHDLSLAAFRWWRWKLKKKETSAPEETGGQAMRLVPVRVVDPETRSPTPLSCSSSVPSPFEVLLETGTCIRVPTDFDAEALGRLLRTLEAVEC